MQSPHKIKDGKKNYYKLFDIPETMGKHVHYLQQWFYTQLPGKIIKLSEKNIYIEDILIEYYSKMNDAIHFIPY